MNSAARRTTTDRAGPTASVAAFDPQQLIAVLMMGNTHTPSGYCPHCGYRIDPGQCPECGAVVPAKKLLRVPPRVRFRRRALALALVILGAPLAVGVHRLIATGAWRRYAPTPVLLALKDDPSWSIFRELARRYQAGRLTPTQAQQLFDQFLQPRADFELIDPHPAYVPIRVKLDIAFDEYGLARQLTASALPQIWIDGQQIDAQAAPPTNSSWTSQVSTRPIQKLGESVVLPGLPPGQHNLVFVQDLLYLPGASPTMAVPPVWTLRVSQTITVVDQPPSAFVTPRSDDERGNIQGEVQFKPDPPREDWDAALGRMIPLRFRSIPAPIVGTLELRLDSEHEFCPIKRIVYDGKGEYRESIDLSGISGITAAQRADVRIVPGPPEMALEYGMREYYGQVIEWHDVLLATDIAVSEADESLAQVFEFLKEFGGQFGKPYCAQTYQLRFEGKLAVLPTELQQELQKHYPQFRFSVARMRYSLGYHFGPINLMVISDADSGEIRTHAPALWMDTPAADFESTFCGLPCRDVRDVERKALVLASFLAFAMDGEVGAPAMSVSNRAVDVELLWPHWSMDKPYRRLRLSFDEQFVVSRVEVLH